MVKNLGRKARGKTVTVNNLRKRVYTPHFYKCRPGKAKDGANRLMNEFLPATLFLRVTQSRLGSMYVVTVKEKDVTVEVLDGTRR